VKKKSFRNTIFEYFCQIFSVLPPFLSKHVLKNLIFQDKDPTNVPDPVVLDKPRRGRKPKNPLPKPDDSSAVPEVNS
jgi:hypothetical protein